MRKKIGVFLAVFLSFLIGFYFAADYYITRKVEEKINVKLKALKPELNVTYKKCDVSLLKKSVVLGNITITGSAIKKPISISKLKFEKIDRENRIPHYGKIDVSGIKIPVANFPEEIRYFLEILGYKGKLYLNTALDYQFNSEKRNFFLNRYLLDIKDGGNFIVSLKLTEIPEFKNINSIESIVFKLLSIKVADGKIVYTDKGLYEKVITALSNYKNLPPEKVKKKIESRIEKAFGNDNLSSMVKKALIKFVRNPEKIQVEIHPEKPETIGNLLFNTSYENMVKKLNLKIESY